MSKVAAIDVAVRLQLGSDNKGSADYTKVMGTIAGATTGTQATAGTAGYGYDKNGIQLFLINVANRLKLDSPSLIFDWRGLDPSTCLESNLVVLIGQIECATEIPGTSS